MASRFNSELLVRARVDLGMTQEEAARDVGVDVRTYRRYESGEVNEAGDFTMQRASRRKIVQRIAAELGLDEAQLVVDDLPKVALETSGHVLSRARHFVGREEALAELGRFVRGEGPARVVAVVAIGGAGKTSLVERCLELSARPALVWSFYEDPRIDAWFDAVLAAYGAVAGTGDLAERVASALSRADRPLLVLDGFEVLQSSGQDRRTRGEIDDSRMTTLLRRLARGLGSARAIVTSRFPVSDLAPWEGSGAMTKDLPALTREESVALLERWGIRGGRDLDAIATRAGCHALTVAMIGSYVGGFLGGDASRLERVDLADAAQDDVLARRLQKVLDGHAAKLGVADRDLLCRVCAFPRGASVESLQSIAHCGGDVAGALSGLPPARLEASLVRLERAGLLFSGARRQRYSAHPFVRQHFQALLGVERAALHEMERARLAASLDLRPDILPTSSAALDSIESLFEHTLLAGRVEEAAAIYARTLGGFPRLGLELGELDRGLRCVSAFAQPPYGSGGLDAASLSESLSGGRRARLAYEWGLYASALGDLGLAIRCYEEQNRMAAASGDDVAQLTGLRTLAYTHRLRGDLDIALDHVDLSLAMAERGDIREAILRGLCLRGAILTDSGRVGEGLECFAEARRLGDEPVARRGLWEAECIDASGDHDRAEALTRTNLGVCESLAWGSHAAQCHLLLGTFSLRRGDLAAARAALAAADGWCTRSGEVETVLRAKQLEHRLLAAEGRFEDAEAARANAEDLGGRAGFAPRFIV